MSSSRKLNNRVPMDELFLHLKPESNASASTHAHGQSPQSSQQIVGSDSPRRPRIQATARSSRSEAPSPVQGFVGGRNTAARATRVIPISPQNVRTGTKVKFAQAATKSNKNNQTTWDIGGNPRDLPKTAALSVKRDRVNDRNSDSQAGGSNASLPATRVPTTPLPASRKRSNNDDSDEEGSGEALPDDFTTPAGKIRRKNRVATILPDGVPTLQPPFRYVYQGKLDDGIDNLYVVRDGDIGREWKYDTNKELFVTIHLEQLAVPPSDNDELLNTARTLIAPLFYLIAPPFGNTPRHLRVVLENNVFFGCSIPYVGNEGVVLRRKRDILKSARVLTEDETPRDALPLPHPYRYICASGSKGEIPPLDNLIVWNSQESTDDAFDYLHNKEFLVKLCTEKGQQKPRNESIQEEQEANLYNEHHIDGGIQQANKEPEYGHDVGRPTPETLDIDSPMPSAYEESGDYPQRPDLIPTPESERDLPDAGSIDGDSLEDSEVTKALLRSSSDRTIAPAMETAATQETITENAQIPITAPSMEIPVTPWVYNANDQIIPTDPATFWQGADADITEMNAPDMPKPPTPPTPMLQDGHGYSAETERSDADSRIGSPIIPGAYVETSQMPEHDLLNITENSGVRTYNSDADDEDEDESSDDDRNGDDDNNNAKATRTVYDRPHAYQEDWDQWGEGGSRPSDATWNHPGNEGVHDSPFDDGAAESNPPNWPPRTLLTSPKSIKGKGRAAPRSPTPSRPHSSNSEYESGTTDIESDEADSDGTTRPNYHIRTIPRRKQVTYSRHRPDKTAQFSPLRAPGRPPAPFDVYFEQQLKPSPRQTGGRSPVTLQENASPSERHPVRHQGNSGNMEVDDQPEFLPAAAHLRPPSGSLSPRRDLQPSGSTALPSSSFGQNILPRKQVTHSPRRHDITDQSSPLQTRQRAPPGDYFKSQLKPSPRQTGGRRPESPLHENASDSGRDSVHQDGSGNMEVDGQPALPDAAHLRPPSGPLSPRRALQPSGFTALPSSSVVHPSAPAPLISSSLTHSTITPAAPSTGLNQPSIISSHSIPQVPSLGQPSTWQTWSSTAPSSSLAMGQAGPSNHQHSPPSFLTHPTAPLLLRREPDSRPSNPFTLPHNQPHLNQPSSSAFAGSTAGPPERSLHSAAQPSAFNQPNIGQSLGSGPAPYNFNFGGRGDGFAAVPPTNDSHQGSVRGQPAIGQSSGSSAPHSSTLNLDGPPFATPPYNPSQESRSGPSEHHTSRNQPPSFRSTLPPPPTQPGIGQSSRSPPNLFDLGGFASGPSSQRSAAEPSGFARPSGPPQQSNTFNFHPSGAAPRRRRGARHSRPENVFQPPVSPVAHSSSSAGGSERQPPWIHALHGTNLHAAANIFVSELARQFGPIVASAIQAGLQGPAEPLAPPNPQNKTAKKRNGSPKRQSARDLTLKDVVRKYRALLIPPDRELDLNPGHEEAAAYADAYEEDPRADFECSVNFFRVYLGATPGHRWNLSAQTVFVRGIIAHQNFLDTSDVRNELRRLFNGQVKYLIQKYRDQPLTPAQKAARAAANASRTRKSAAYQRRRSVFIRMPKLSSHLKTFDDFGTNGMSSDEEVTIGGQKRYFIRQPIWRHPSLRLYMRILDILYDKLQELRDDPRGPSPRIRETGVQTQYSRSTTYVRKLPVNAYDEIWLNNIIDAEFLVDPGPQFDFNLSVNATDIAFSARALRQAEPYTVDY